MTRDERDKIVSELANYRLKGKTRWDIVNALDSVVEKAAKAGVCFNDSSLGCSEVILPISKYCFFDPETCGYSEPLHKDPSEGSAAQAKEQELKAKYAQIKDLLSARVDYMAEQKAKEEEINSLRYLCSQAYQIAGVLSSEMDNDRLEPLMDNLSGGAKGEDLPHKQLLPFNPCDKESNMYHEVFEIDGKTPVDWKVEYFIDDGNNHKQKMGAGKYIRRLKKELKAKDKTMSQQDDALARAGEIIHSQRYKIKRQSGFLSGLNKCLAKKNIEIKRLTEENAELKKEKNYRVNHGYEEYLESYVDEYQKDIEYLNDKLSKIKDIL